MDTKIIRFLTVIGFAAMLGICGFGVYKYMNPGPKHPINTCFSIPDPMVGSITVKVIDIVDDNYILRAYVPLAPGIIMPIDIPEPQPIKELDKKLEDGGISDCECPVIK